MKRLICRSFGTRDGFAIETRPDPSPGADEVLVEIRAANLAFVDRLIARGAYQIRPALPFTPGVVGAGVVVATGEQVGHLQPGDRVVVLKADNGTFSTHVVVPADAVVRTPSGISDEMAAASIEAYGTAAYALEERGNLRAGETVLILGAGGAVGHAAVEIATQLDAKVVVVTSDPEFWQTNPVKPHTIIDRRVAHLRETMRARFPDGVDMVLDPVGGDMAEAALRSLNFGGRYLVVGFASGTIPRLPVNHVLLRNRSVVGVEWASWIRENPRHVPRSMETVLNRLGRGVLHPPQPRLVNLDDLPEELLSEPPASGLIRTVVLPFGQRAESEPAAPDSLVSAGRA
jgi:NADPH2:quinone reductase